MQENTTYTKTTMNVDHFWDIGVNEDGHHKYAQMPKYKAGGLPSDPALAAGMDLAFFSKEKTAVESPAQQDVQPFAINSTNTMQLLGIRACGSFSINNATGAITYNYLHNVTSVTRTAKGKYTVTYTNALPSTAYLVLATGMRYNAGDDKLTNISVASSLAGTTKTTALVKLIASAMTGDLIDPLQIYFVCFGG